MVTVFQLQFQHKLTALDLLDVSFLSVFFFFFDPFDTLDGCYENIHEE